MLRKKYRYHGARVSSTARQVLSLSDLVLVSGKHSHKLTDSWKLTDILTVPIFSTVAVALMNDRSMEITQTTDSESKNAFMNHLAHHNDPRIREVVATQVGLSDETLGRLARDTSHDVRLALVSNIDAVKRLDSNVLREMIGEDVDLYTESLVSLTNLTCLTIFNQLAHSGTETLRQKTKTEEYIAEGLKHPDIEVRETAYRMKLRLANSIENPGTVEKHLGRQNLQTEVLPIDLYGQADDYFYYLGISQETPGVKTLLLPLPLYIT